MNMDWQEKWELYARLNRARLDEKSVSDLLDDVQAGRYGNYYSIWYSIADRANLEEAGWILYDVLNRDIDYLYRYHCAVALLRLLGNTEFQPVDLSSENHNMDENLKRLEKRLRRQGR